MDNEHLFKVVDVLDEVAEETGKTIPQITINWLLQRPTVSSVIIGARKKTASGLSRRRWLEPPPEQVSRLDTVSTVTAAYPYRPYRRLDGFKRLNPPLV